MPKKENKEYIMALDPLILNIFTGKSDVRYNLVFEFVFSSRENSVWLFSLTNFKKVYLVKCLLLFSGKRFP